MKILSNSFRPNFISSCLDSAGIGPSPTAVHFWPIPSPVKTGFESEIESDSCIGSYNPAILTNRIQSNEIGSRVTETRFLGTKEVGQCDVRGTTACFHLSHRVHWGIYQLTY